MSLQADRDRFEAVRPVTAGDPIVTTWAGAVPADLARRAREVADDVVLRMSTPQQVLELAVRSADQAEHPMGWQYPGFAHGHAGVSLLHLAAARAASGGERDRAESVAFDFIREAVAGTRIAPMSDPGTFGGVAGLALCVADSRIPVDRTSRAP